MMDKGKYLKELISRLSEPMSHKWRVQAFSQNYPTAQCVAYVDARQVMDRLDEVCEWQDKYFEVGGQLYCSIGIKLDEEWQWRTDCGTESNVEKEKGQASDAFKRAAVKWGVGRFLYSLKIRRVATNAPKSDKNRYPFVVDGDGKRVYCITDHINQIIKSENQAS